MKKKLVTAQNVADFVDSGANLIQVDSSMIVTAGAKDYLREKGIKIVYGKQENGPCSAAVDGTTQDVRAVVTRIVSILRNDLQVGDAATVESVTRKVLCSLKQG